VEAQIVISVTLSGVAEFARIWVLSNGMSFAPEFLRIRLRVPASLNGIAFNGKPQASGIFDAVAFGLPLNDGVMSAPSPNEHIT